MKCPHYSQEHPDTTKFCPETGKKLESQALFCNNPECNFRQPLPLRTNFCPNCGKPLSERTQQNSSNNNEDMSSCIMLKVDYDRAKFIDTKCNTLYEKSFENLDYCYDDNIRVISNCIVTDNSKAYLVLNTGELLEMGDYNERCKYAVSRNGEYILIVQNRNASLYKRDLHSGLALISQFHIKTDEDGIGFTIVGEYISLSYKDRFASINIRTGEILKIPGYKYSMLLAIRGEECVFLASNTTISSSDDVEGCHVVDIHGNRIESFPKGAYFPVSETSLLRVYNDNQLAELIQCVLNSPDRLSVYVIDILENCHRADFCNNSGKKTVCYLCKIPNDHELSRQL